MAQHVFKKNDVVAYKGAFLRSVGWYTNVPRNGEVVDDTDPEMPSVLWCDDVEPIRVRASNLILFSELHLDPV